MVNAVWFMCEGQALVFQPHPPPWERSEHCCEKGKSAEGWRLSRSSLSPRAKNRRYGERTPSCLCVWRFFSGRKGVGVDERVKDIYRKFIKNRKFDRALEVLQLSYAEDKKGTYPLIQGYRNGQTALFRAGKSAEIYELLRAAYILTARDYFDDFCIAFEWNRRPEHRFYLPRRKQLLRITKELQRLADGEIDILGVSLPPGVGKALADDTPVLTRNGWKNHGDLVVGDEVIGLDGQFKKVIRVLPKCMLDCLVEFSNGEKIQCHERHEWMTYSRSAWKYILEETWKYEGYRLESGGEKGKRGHRYTYQLPPRFVVGEEKELFSPYFLGVWLGDGSNRQPRITNHKKDYAIIEKIHNLGYTERRIYTQDRQPGTEWYDFDIRTELHKYGMCYDGRRTEKHIPQEYLTASIDQRLELLAGLIDTDGTLCGNKYIFTTCDTDLRDTFVELISTFGWRACVTVHAPIKSSSGIEGRKDTFCIGFTPDRFIPCALERKRLKVTHPQRKIAMVKITRVEPKQGNCITVEGDGMYLAGKTMIPTHNTGLAQFYIDFNVGRDPMGGNLISSHNGGFLRGLYDEFLRQFDPDGDYCFYDIFPERRLVKTNANDLKLDMDKAQRFSSIQHRSIQGGNAGLSRAVYPGILYIDDPVEGIEEAMSEERLEAKWQKINTDLIQRVLGVLRLLIIQTRWSLRDPIGRLQMQYENDPRAVFLAIPALNEKGESNFDYGGNIGYTTAAFKKIKELQDPTVFAALYQNEPVERSGILFHPEDLMRYTELPAGEPDAVWAVCDTKNKGDDYFCMPIAYQYGDKYYIEKIICDNREPRIVEPRLVDALVSHKVKLARFESNSAGGRIAENVQDKINEKGGITKISTKYSTANKDTRILADAGFIKDRFLFKDQSQYDHDQEYRTAMNMLFVYSNTGKSRHDDVPDALSMLANFVQKKVSNKAVVLKRPF